MNIQTYVDKHFARLAAAYQRDMDSIDEYEERKAALCADYEKQGDFYDAIGSVECEGKLNLLWQARNRRDFNAMCRLMDEIMAAAADSYAEVKMVEEDEKNEERKMAARPFRHCGR